jgi:exonuclease III
VPSLAPPARTLDTRTSLGFRPGKCLPLTLGTWNTLGGFDAEEGLVDYCQTETKTDILGVQEVRRDITGRRSRRLIAGGAPPDNDSSSGVALILSERASAQVELRGENEGSRIVWARFRGTPHDLLVINCYIPHHARANPSREQTMKEVFELARSLHRKGDCLVIMGDFNSKMARSSQGITGKYCMHRDADRGGELMADMCRDLELFAASTRFCPGKAELGAATYISVRHRKPSQIDYILVSKGPGLQSRLETQPVQVWARREVRSRPPAHHLRLQAEEATQPACWT